MRLVIVLYRMELVIDMDDADVFEDAEIIVEGDCIIDAGRPPLLIKVNVSVPPPPNLRDPAILSEHLRKCKAAFTGDRRACGTGDMLAPTSPQTGSLPHYTSDIQQALMYSQCLFETLLTLRPFDTIQWPGYCTRLQHIHSIISVAAHLFSPLIVRLIRLFGPHWHRGDLGLALAVVFRAEMDKVMRRVNTVLDEPAVTAIPVIAAGRTRTAIVVD